MSVPVTANGEYLFSHAYYPECFDCTNLSTQVELYTIQEVHEWCEAHSKEHGCKEIRVEHVIHWEVEEANA